MININKRKAALLIGISLLIMAIAAGIAYGAIHNSLIIFDNEALTYRNISNNIFKFNIEILLWIIIIITDLLICIGIWNYYKSKSNIFSNFTVVLRLIYTIILFISVHKLIQVSIIVNNADNIRVLPFIFSFENIWSKGLIIFGFHLIFWGITVLKETKLWGILIIIAGVSYSLIHLMDNFFPMYLVLKNTLETVLILPMTLGELGLGIWLLIRGGKTIKASS